MPTIGNTQLKLLEKLCNAMAVSGDEGEVRQIVLDEIKGYADQVKVDALGNVLVTRRGTERRAEPVEARSRSASQDRLKVMLAAHIRRRGHLPLRDRRQH
jgi:endoglucanase